MKTDERIPFGVTDYIQKKFREEFLFEVKDIRKNNGHAVYTIEVSKDDYIHTLRLDENGTLLKEEVSEAFPPDIHEERTFGEVPE
jgi:hypothetical protein